MSSLEINKKIATDSKRVLAKYQQTALVRRYWNINDEKLLETLVSRLLHYFRKLTSLQKNAFSVQLPVNADSILMFFKFTAIGFKPMNQGKLSLYYR